MTEWRSIAGYEGLYEVSDDGRVRSLSRVVRRGGSTMRLKERELKHIPNNGYWAVTLHRGDGGKRHLVHRLVALAFIGDIPPGMEVCHGDDDKTNNSVRNLRIDTRAENALDVVRHGYHNKASRTHCPQGHEYTSDNTYRYPRGNRSCRECRRKHALNWYYRQKSTKEEA